jgi:hypothetical protein
MVNPQAASSPTNEAATPSYDSRIRHGNNAIVGRFP